ncbi:metallophosphoesterase [Solidesulfovibrio sp.]|uniref:metallophosphoesterase family protein n=1 Tax=Solidesulfovibrio sp. TaxID=2910990 RepID=UPI00261FA205|nr:metallophosphoesterase [Solidesulfovibrio sp.]
MGRPVRITRRAALGAIAVLAAAPFVWAGAPAPSCRRLVVLADAHYAPPEPGPDGRPAAPDQKLAAVRDVNSWPDAELVTVVGDIVHRYGSPQEYETARQFVGAIRKPLALVAGNHEYMYEDAPGPDGRLRRASPELRRRKLARYREAFGQKALYYAKDMGKYLLVFCAPDATAGRLLTEMSPGQLSWLEKTLAADRARPTILFYHAPLVGTLDHYNANADTPDFVAQPVDRIRNILAGNPQVLLWVSGHTHTPPTNPSFNAPRNWYLDRVLDVHTPDMNRPTVWSNNLYLCDDRIVVRTWDHSTGSWLTRDDRTVFLRGL